MRKILGISLPIILITAFLSCRQSSANHTQTDSNVKLEVLYFHVTERCRTCLSIENNTKKVLDDNFKTQMDNGIIKFTSYNIEKKENKSLIEKYQISYLTLLLIRSDGTKTDFTNAAFKYAEAKPEEFEELLKAEIENSLK
jgi:hypothetical protein